MKNNTVKKIIIFLLILPLTISFILACNNIGTEDDKKENDYVGDLYVPKTMENREHYYVRKTDTFMYICIFGLFSIAGATYLFVKSKRNKK